MRQIKGKNTKPEMLVRKFLHKNGFRYRLHLKNLPGKPDIVLPKYKIAIFVNGCFFHQHSCHYFKWPINNQEFWKKKIIGNVVRDKRAIKALKKDDWKVIIVWECQLKPKKIKNTLSGLLNKLSNQHM